MMRNQPCHTGANCPRQTILNEGDCMDCANHRPAPSAACGCTTRPAEPCRCAARPAEPCRCTARPAEPCRCQTSKATPCTCAAVSAASARAQSACTRAAEAPACECAIMPACSREDAGRSELMQKIMQCEFICIDINLYLDTHPCDERALSDYNCYAEQLRVLKDMYVSKYGPLQNFGNSISEGSWKWIDQPWPWCTLNGMEV